MFRSVDLWKKAVKRENVEGFGTRRIPHQTSRIAGANRGFRLREHNEVLRGRGREARFREGEKTVEVSSPLSAVKDTTADRTPAHLQRSTVLTPGMVNGEWVEHAVGRVDICIGWFAGGRSSEWRQVEDEAGHKRWLLRGSIARSFFLPVM